MARRGRKPAKYKKNFRRNINDETANMQSAKDRKRQSKKSKSLVKQMRGMKWDEEEYSEEFEEELDDI